MERITYFYNLLCFIKAPQSLQFPSFLNYYFHFFWLNNILPLYINRRKKDEVRCTLFLLSFISSCEVSSSTPGTAGPRGGKDWRNNLIVYMYFKEIPTLTIPLFCYEFVTSMIFHLRSSQLSLLPVIRQVVQHCSWANIVTFRNW